MPLRYLLHLEHANLPMHVTDAQDVRRVSVLKATGLIEAAIDPAFDTDHGSYRLAQAALVVCITEEGHAEIASLKAGAAASALEDQKWPVMPLDYLRKIGNSVFPLRIDDPTEINSVAVLNAAGMVEATLPPPCRTRQSPQKFRQAVVLRVTPLGRTALVERRA